MKLFLLLALFTPASVSAADSGWIWTWVSRNEMSTNSNVINGSARMSFHSSSFTATCLSTQEVDDEDLTVFNGAILDDSKVVAEKRYAPTDDESTKYEGFMTYVRSGPSGTALQRQSIVLSNGWRTVIFSRDFVNEKIK